MKSVKTFLACAALLGAASSAPAQWVINEYQSDSVGSPDSQFVELYNATPGQSVTGLSLIAIRLSTGRASYDTTLTGTATGNYFVVGSDTFDTNFGSTADQVVIGGFLRGSFQQVILVNTADLPAGYTGDPANYVFQASDFNSGADIIDAFTAGEDSSLDPALYAGFAEYYISGSSAFGGQRYPDGASSYETPTTAASAPALWANASPGASNVTPAAVSDWMMF